MPDGAVLGVVLAERTLVPVARRLAELRIPFLLVTGLEKEALPLPLRNVPYLGKPYLREQLIGALESTIAAASRPPSTAQQAEVE
jgi:hypothetical protein